MASRARSAVQSLTTGHALPYRNYLAIRIIESRGPRLLHYDPKTVDTDYMQEDCDLFGIQPESDDMTIFGVLSGTNNVN